MEADGFDWDEGNRDKCRKHGLSIPEIEAAFAGVLWVGPDSYPIREVRFRAVGRTLEGRYVFVVFTWRRRSGLQLIRPLSARYMHRKEIDHYENAVSGSGQR
ncbi:BrnT family toxin [Methylobacterium aerolatum]|uniref:BrnT family toxin n=1 Tax=Methylobacterium aerolatum TaxID=418708 RepID=UPI001EDF635B|nr:BrnT family toxin [Methylobacterium aerolatum]